MEKWMRKGGASGPQEDTLAEIQARLEVCEEDMEEALGDKEATHRRASDVSEEADEIGRLLEELMTPPETEPNDPNIDNPHSPG